MVRMARVLPALLVSGLFILLLSSWVVPKQSPQIMAGWKGPCAVYPTSGLDYAAINFPHSVVQPVPFIGNVYACSLTIQRVYSSGYLYVVQVDPTTLLPDPTTLALRTVYFDMTALAYGYTRREIYPPVIVRSLPHVAEPPAPTLGLKYNPYNSQQIAFDPDGAITAPQAYRVDSAGAASSLPGTHPVLRHTVCAGDSSVQSLSVAQCVMTTNTLCADTTIHEVIQKFRVPMPVQITGIDIAPGGVRVQPYGPQFVAILDAHGNDEPPATFTSADFLARADLPFYFQTIWMTSYDPDQHPILVPNHDYWLLVRSAHTYSLHGRIRTGSESDDFNAGIGSFHTRGGFGTGPWSERNDVSLSFRLIGSPAAGAAATVGVGGSRATSLTLSVAPNPSSGVPTVAWSGARGAVQLSIVDARGRRVGGTRMSGAEGRWRAGERTILPAGVYFARVTDAQGTVGERFVILR